jgi:uncharacterized protein YciU (UPF0263 family)
MKKEIKPFSAIDSECTVDSHVVLAFAILLMHKLRHAEIIDKNYAIKIVKYPKHDAPRDVYCFSFEFEYFGQKRRLFCSVEENWVTHFNFSIASEKFEGGWLMMPIFVQNDNPNVFSSHLNKMDQDFNKLRQAIRKDILKEAIEFISESEHITLKLIRAYSNTKLFDIVSENQKFKAMMIKIKVVENVKFTMFKKEVEKTPSILLRIDVNHKRFFACFHNEIEKHANQ